MNADAKKLHDRYTKRVTEVGAADLAVMNAESARSQARQQAAAAWQQFQEHCMELATAAGLDPSTAKFNLEKYELVIPEGHVMPASEAADAPPAIEPAASPLTAVAVVAKPIVQPFVPGKRMGHKR
jgi:hypothetical protein